jgi:hypothetical protein
MKLSTGKIAFPIEFDNGDKQNIYFNPNDPDLSIRMRDFEKKVNARISEIDDVKLKADGTPEDIKLIEQFRQIRDIVCEELDVAFGSPISAIVFKHCSPFAIVDGNYFILLFLEAIKPEIEKTLKKSKVEAEKKLEKHIAKYKR